MEPEQYYIELLNGRIDHMLAGKCPHAVGGAHIEAISIEEGAQMGLATLMVGTRPERGLVEAALPHLAFRRSWKTYGCACLRYAPRQSSRKATVTNMVPE